MPPPLRCSCAYLSLRQVAGHLPGIHRQPGEAVPSLVGTKARGAGHGLRLGTLGGSSLAPFFLIV
jgi:hypothetical protein